MNVRRILVANRGEIARRVFATCRARGLGTVAIHSDPDADAPFVAEADLAVRLPGATPAETYLDIAKIIDAARRSEADAIHPGYGFGSENPDFAEAVIAAGLTWIGPPPQAMRQMASKVVAKQLMATAGVPVLQQIHPAEVSERDLPVMIKASAGGGGRGMRIVDSLAELQTAWQKASREAAAAFGDGEVFCERYLSGGHHIEVQVLADNHDAVWTLGERECSVQRRHQKVLEEAPSPLVDRLGPRLRAELFAAAERAARAINYRGAGTVEFLVEPDGRFHFLEMNTRLQVEHPVTEQRFGVDLVGLQLDVAAGIPLPAEQPTGQGHAIEVRLYAEDPSRDYQPQTGTVLDFAVPSAGREFSVDRCVDAGVRVDSGIVSGSKVGAHYDAMLAKIIAVADHRLATVQLLTDALRRTRCSGVITNLDLLLGILADTDFRAGAVDTSYLADERVARIGASQLSQAECYRVAAVARASELTGSDGFPLQWRGFEAPWTKTEVEVNGRPVSLAWRGTRDGLVFAGSTGDQSSPLTVQPGPVSIVTDAGVVRRYRVSADESAGHRRWWVSGVDGQALVIAPARFLDPGDRVPEGSLVAPMPGTVLRVEVAQGDRVTQGQPLLYLEAMKMEHVIAAPFDGVISEAPVGVGSQVTAQQVLAVITTEES